jgi:hypothetical protein
LAEAIPLDDGGKQARSPGSTKETVKTIARGMPGDSGVTVVTCSCAFFICTRGCGRIERPAFPAPSDRSGAGIQSKNSGAGRGEIAKLCLRLISGISRIRGQLASIAFTNQCKSSSPG